MLLSFIFICNVIAYENSLVHIISQLIFLHTFCVMYLFFSLECDWPMMTS